MGNNKAVWKREAQYGSREARHICQGLGGSRGCQTWRERILAKAWRNMYILDQNSEKNSMYSIYLNVLINA